MMLVLPKMQCVMYISLKIALKTQFLFSEFNIALQTRKVNRVSKSFSVTLREASQNLEKTSLLFSNYTAENGNGFEKNHLRFPFFLLYKGYREGKPKICFDSLPEDDHLPIIQIALYLKR